MQLYQNYSCASAHDLHMVPLILPAIELAKEVTSNGLIVDIEQILKLLLQKKVQIRRILSKMQIVWAEIIK